MSVDATRRPSSRSRFSNLSAEYKKLENEFRDALKIEERRYQQVRWFSRVPTDFLSFVSRRAESKLFKSNEILQKENEILQINSNQIKEKDQSNRKMLDELINVRRVSTIVVNCRSLFCLF